MHEKRKEKTLAEETETEREKMTNRKRDIREDKVLFVPRQTMNESSVTDYCLESLSVIITGNETHASSRPFPSIK